MEEDPVVLSVEKALRQDLTALAKLECGWARVVLGCLKIKNAYFHWKYIVETN